MFYTSDRPPRVSLSNSGLLLDDADAHITEEPSFTAAVNATFTSRTGDDMIACVLWLEQEQSDSTYRVNLAKLLRAR